MSHDVAGSIRASRSFHWNEPVVSFERAGGLTPPVRRLAGPLYLPHASPSRVGPNRLMRIGVSDPPEKMPEGLRVVRRRQKSWINLSPTNPSPFVGEGIGARGLRPSPTTAWFRPMGTSVFLTEDNGTTASQPRPVLPRSQAPAWERRFSKLCFELHSSFCCRSQGGHPGAPGYPLSDALFISFSAPIEDPPWRDAERKTR